MKKLNMFHNKMKAKITSIIGLLALLAAFTGCKTPKLENGGAYAPGATNSAGVFVPSSAPDLALFIADSAYKLSYDAVDAVFAFERDNRAKLQSVSPSIKTALDSIRPQALDIDRRWALARAAYKVSPTPANLTVVQEILAEIQRLVPVVQSQLTITQ
jgi:hypothetical protein